MRGLPCKTLLLSALLLDAIILLADGLEALLAMQGITPYVTSHIFSRSGRFPIPAPLYRW